MQEARTTFPQRLHDKLQEHFDSAMYRTEGTQQSRDGYYLRIGPFKLNFKLLLDLSRNRELFYEDEEHSVQLADDIMREVHKTHQDADESSVLDPSMLLKQPLPLHTRPAIEACDLRYLARHHGYSQEHAQTPGRSEAHRRRYQRHPRVCRDRLGPCQQRGHDERSIRGRVLRSHVRSLHRGAGAIHMKLVSEPMYLHATLNPGLRHPALHRAYSMAQHACIWHIAWYTEQSTTVCRRRKGPGNGGTKWNPCPPSTEKPGICSR